MIENEFEVFIVMNEDDLTGETKVYKGTLEFLDIKYYHDFIHKGVHVTAIALITGDELLINLTYEKFKEKYNKRKAEIIASNGSRP